MSLVENAGAAGAGDGKAGDGAGAGAAGGQGDQGSNGQQNNQGQQNNNGDQKGAGDGANIWYYDDGKPGEGERPEWLSSKYKTAAEQAKAYNEAQKKLGAFKGAPEEYDLEIPDMPDAKFQKDDPLLSSFLEDAKKNNVSQEYVTNLLKTYVNMQKASRPDPDKEMEKLGVNAKQDIQILAQWGDNVLTKEESTLFKNMMTTAESVRLFEKFRGLLTQADTQPNNPRTPRESEAEVRKMIHDPRYDTDESFRSMVREKLKQFGG